MASVSMTVAPSCANSAATVLLPLPMPPVSPTLKLGVRTMALLRSSPAQPVENATRAGEHHDHTGPGEKGTEGNIAALAQCIGELHRDADDRAQHGSRQNDRQNHWSAEPGTERRQQLEVAVTHAFFAGGELEQPVHRPQRNIACHRTPQSGCEWNRPAQRRTD